MRILVFQHLAVEHPGVFREFWRDAGHVWDVVELDAGEPVPPLDPYDRLVVMGGPMDVWQEDAFPWLRVEKAAIRRWVAELDRPFLGLCLGHQLLADATGGSVGPMRRPEVGLAPVDITQVGRTSGLLGDAARIETFQWHGAEVTALPPGAEVLATNDACGIQAMRVGRQAYGVQFHVEITRTTVAEWAAIPEYAQSLEAALGAGAAAGLERDMAERLPAFRAIAKQMDDHMIAAVAAQAR